MSTVIGFRPLKKTLGRLGDRLLADGVIANDQLRQGLERQKQTGGFLGEILVALGIVTAGQLKPYLEDITGFPFVDISEEEVDPKVYSLFPETVIVRKKALPFKDQDGHIFVAMADPLNLATLDELRANSPKPLVPCLALGGDLTDAIKRLYNVRVKAESLLSEIPVEGAEFEDPLAGLLDQASQAPIVRLVNNIISGAIAVNASDIHIEPQEGNTRVRYRIDGLLYEQMTLPSNHHAACVSRLKIMSGLDIAERRRGQDGRFSTTEQGAGYDVRLSIMPTVYGEKACMRLLEKANSLARIDRLGFTSEQRILFERLIARPHGILLVTGPTGCGKTTTLYAALQAINDTTKNINTVEDPVEYRLAGVNQMQVNPKIGVTFANGLRGLVRQDPDVILVGEIRDKETAEIAIQAALTGHLVLSTLHTTNAGEALIRLQHMGVEPFLISSAVIGVMAQRLTRTLCPYCRETYTATPDEAMALGLSVQPGTETVLAREKGCKRCSGRGSKGRTAAFEIMPMTEALRDMILAGATAQDLSGQAATEGVITMRDAAIRKALDLVISPQEITRVFAEEEE